MDAEILENGHLLVPVTQTTPDGGYGLSYTEVGPDDPVYHEWVNYYKRIGEVPKEYDSKTNKIVRKPRDDGRIVVPKVGNGVEEKSFQMRTKAGGTRTRRRPGPQSGDRDDLPNY